MSGKHMDMQLYEKICFSVSMMATLVAVIADHVPPGGFGPSSGFGGSYGPPPIGGGISSQYGAPSGGFGGGHGYAPQGGGGSGHGGDYNEVPKSYQFGYAVQDYASGNDYKRHETSDGNVVQGEYRVQLPDGRTQIVSYTADWQNGFRAKVSYEGQANYPAAGGAGGYPAGAPQYPGAGGGYPSNTYQAPGFQAHQQAFQPHGGSTFTGSPAGGFVGQKPGTPTSYGPPGYHK